MSLNPNAEETTLVANLKQVIDYGYTGGGIGSSVFIGDASKFQAAANDVFTLVKKQGVQNTGEVVLSIAKELSGLNTDNWNNSQSLCNAFEKGMSMPKCALNVVYLEPVSKAAVMQPNPFTGITL